MSYHVKYSARQSSWYIEVDGSSDDFGTSLYDTEQEAYDELAQMVTEGLIKQEEIRPRETCGHGTWFETCYEPHGEIRGSLPKGSDR